MADAARDGARMFAAAAADPSNLFTAGAATAAAPPSTPTGGRRPDARVGQSPPAKRLDAGRQWKALPEGITLSHEQMAQRLLALERHYEASMAQLNYVTMDHAARHDAAADEQQVSDHRRENTGAQLLKLEEFIVAS